MKYPIDAEKCIADLKLKFGQNPTVEKLFREDIIPFVNDAYAAGLSGEEGYPIDAETYSAVFAEVLDKPPEAVRAIGTLHRTVKWANIAYEQGRQDAGRAAT